MQKIITKNDDANTVIGKKIQILRKKKGIMQATLAKQLMISRPTLSIYESGKAIFSIDFLFEISEKLEVGFLDLIPDDYKKQIITSNENHDRYNLEDDIEFGLEMAIRHYLRLNKVKNDVLSEKTQKAILFIKSLSDKV